MKYQIFKLKFTTGVRFGTGGLNKGAGTLYADTIFSALCHEALLYGSDTLEKLVGAVKSGKLLISDGLPYIGDRYYIPKPLVRLNFEKEGDSILKKAMKKMEYLPVDGLQQYLEGKLDIKKEADYFHENFGKSSLIEKVAIRTLDEDPEKENEPAPYAVNVFQYCEGSGLYICVGYESEELFYDLGDLFDSLSYSGIGGKRTAGYGRFTVTQDSPDAAFAKRLTSDSYQSYMTLTTALPADHELEDALKENEGYRLVKRSGFAVSSSYADSFRKKKDFYLMAAGASFRRKFQGNIFDVSAGGAHPVYRYARPIFMGVL